MTTKTYDVIYIDPPWDYGASQHGGKDALSGAAHTHYDVMTLKKLKAFELPETSDNAVMFMWTTGPFLEKSLTLMTHWGFKYTTVAFVWDKIRSNVGYSTRGQTEFVILGKKGKYPEGWVKGSVKQFLSEKRTIHSQKPAEIRDRVAALTPNMNRIEVFSRHPDPRFDYFGNQTIVDDTVIRNE